MTIAAFVGPSLRAADRARFVDMCWLPPAEAGDLLRLDHAAYAAICVIDGFFDHRPALRHKEILLLLSRGARIYGASSIGALRAAEMDSFGMIGVGAIYRAYARGTITGDDEVALVHGPPEWDWRPLSLPLVDLKATILAARRRGELSGGEARTLIAAGAGIHYVDRTWETVVAAAERSAGLAAWLRGCEVAQKQADACACIETAQAGRASPGSAPPEMVRTAYIEALAEDCGLVL